MSYTVTANKCLMRTILIELGIKTRNNFMRLIVN